MNITQYQLTSWSRVLLKKLMDNKIVKKFFTFYGIQLFTKCSKNLLLDPIPNRLILVSYNRLNIIISLAHRSPKGTYLLVFPTKFCICIL